MKPMSMLVHISHRITSMAIVNAIISSYLDEIKGRYGANDHSDTLRDQFRKVWDDYIANSNIIIGN